MYPAAPGCSSVKSISTTDETLALPVLLKLLARHVVVKNDNHVAGYKPASGQVAGYLLLIERNVGSLAEFFAFYSHFVAIRQVTTRFNPGA